MYSFYILIIFLGLIILYGGIEFALHQKRIYSIPIRVHINGTRGKSSVTRLIGAGLRNGDVAAVTKVTGTSPVLILEDGVEIKIPRKGMPNILEQKDIVRFAASQKPDALVIECMALQPRYQWISEHQLIHATVGVITNVRMDHLDVMGRTLKEIALALANTIPSNQHLFTAEKGVIDILRDIARNRNTVIHLVDEAAVSADEMRGFRYIEHRENVSLALSVCSHLGVPRQVALQGMYRAAPDAGVLDRYSVKFYGKEVTFYNAFAANDPDSSFVVWNKIKQIDGVHSPSSVLLNTRLDRLYRSRQLIEMIGSKLADKIDYLFLIGQSTNIIETLAYRYGIEHGRVINIGLTEPAVVFEKIVSMIDHCATIIAFGNMGGMGSEVAEYFRHRSENHHD